MLLKKMIEVHAVMRCETALRIGGNKESLEIGGLDNPIIRHPITDLPYVPGSSIKGKMRSLLEAVYGRRRYDKNRGGIAPVEKEPCGCGNCLVCRLFGPHKNDRHKLGPTRLLVRDAKLTEESVALLQKAQLEKGINYSEIKTENSITRETGVAYNPRTIERVPEGCEFHVEMVLKVYDSDREEECVQFLKQGIALLEKDYLGSSGSRGYGKVTFRNLTFQPVEVSSLHSISFDRK